jgi:hypothetical protein
LEVKEMGNSLLFLLDVPFTQTFLTIKNISTFTIMYKTTLLFYSAGLIVGAGIGFAVNNLAIGMGVGAALGLIFARNYRQRRRE